MVGRSRRREFSRNACWADLSEGVEGAACAEDWVMQDVCCTIGLSVGRAGLAEKAASSHDTLTLRLLLKRRSDRARAKQDLPEHVDVVARLIDVVTKKDPVVKLLVEAAARNSEAWIIAGLTR